MNFVPLPRTNVKHVLIPPIKCQGIKTKLVDFVLANVCWDGSGRWIEPFLGSGVMLFNVRPERAIVNDINPHIISLYRQIFDGRLTSDMVADHLTQEGQLLLRRGEEHYYTIRARFNQTANPLDFLFLNRSCFNGVMRFNRKGEFNVPFCRKPDRFRQAYVTKIVNQIKAIQKAMRGKDWAFRVGDWRACLEEIQVNDFVYLDPPYIGRHTDYYDHWSEEDAADLARAAKALPGGFALSMWKENKYRTNSHLAQHWNGLIERTVTHFYHVGSTEDLRNSMEEALLIKPGYESSSPYVLHKKPASQMSFTFTE
jgi:DNA adenine methylase